MSFVARRLVEAVPVLLAVSIVTFGLLYLVPGDPVKTLVGERASPETIANIRRELGLDLPVHERYLGWLGKVLKGDLGRSWLTGRPVAESLAARFPVTARLALTAFAVSVLVGLGLGVYSATRQNTVADHLVRTALLLVGAVPIFVMATAAMYLFGVKLRVLPVSGLGDGSFVYFVLPGTVLGLYLSIYQARMTRSVMLEVIRQDYIRTARAKGLPERVVTWRHAFRNALVTVITLLGGSLSHLLVGSVLTETIFNLPGIGRFTVDAAYARDLPAVMGCFLFQAVVFVVANVLVDIGYAAADPRVRLG
ncbi:MAG: ABC transporter permease [Bacillota bacterium]|nr:MAG: ABC transporter permease [Bacillota bacterium]